MPKKGNVIKASDLMFRDGSQSFSSNATFDAKMFIRDGSAHQGTPTVTLALGDVDTGFKWNSDGNISLYANNSEVINFTGTTITAKKPLSMNNNSITGISRIEIGSSGSTLAIDGTVFTYKGNTVWHSGNDGAGSGLDSDMVDGKQASDFVWKTEKGAPNGVATLGPDGKVPSSQLNISTSANAITITDSGGYYTSGNVEGALQEIGQTLNAMRGNLITSVNNIFNM